jgi:hypothetical protein
MNIEYVEIKGQQVAVLVPEITNTLALVDVNVIKRLASMLPRTNLSDTKDALYTAVRRCSTIQEYVNVLKDEVAFHESVNIITQYQPQAPQTVEEFVTLRHD